MYNFLIYTGVSTVIEITFKLLSLLIILELLSLRSIESVSMIIESFELSKREISTPLNTSISSGDNSFIEFVLGARIVCNLPELPIINFFKSPLKNPKIRQGINEHGTILNINNHYILVDNENTNPNRSKQVGSYN